MASIKIALALSLFVAGLGIAYEGDLELGVGLILLWSMLCLVSIYSDGAVSMFAAVAALAVWAYGMFKTFFIGPVN